MPGDFALKSLRIAALLALLGPGPAHALQYLPEFESLTEEEQASFEGPSLLGSEYQSSVLTYMKPESFEYEFLAHPKAFDFSTGSLDGTHFLMDSRLKIHAPLNDLLEFRFTYFDDRDFEKYSLHAMIELVFWTTDWLGISIYGEPDFFKRKDDTGLALLFKPTPRHEIRLFNTFVDVTLLKRNDRSDTFVEPYLPYARGLVGRLWSDPSNEKKEFFEYAVRFETRTKWLFPDQQYAYEYDRNYASVFLSKPLSPKLRLNARVEYDHKYESREPTSGASTQTPQHWTTERFIPYARLVFSELGPRRDWELTGGVMAAFRWWKTDAGVAMYRDWLPHVMFSIPGYVSGKRRDRIMLSFMATQHNAEGPYQLFSAGEKPDVLETRFNLTYEFHFNDHAVIRLLATGDLDEYGTPGSWEGGNAQMSLLF